MITNEASVSGHDPTTGRELWVHPWPGASDGDANTSQPMDVGKNRVLISKGYGGGAEMFEVVKSDQGDFSTTSIWQNPQVLKTKMTSPVIDGQHAYALSDRILECVDLNTGQRVWKNGRYGHGQLLLINGHLMIHAERGFLATVPRDTRRIRRARPDRYDWWHLLEYAVHKRSVCAGA